MSKEFAIADVPVGQLNALGKNLASQMGIDDVGEAIRRINSGEWTVSQPARRWREQDGVIYLSVISNGMTGEEWIKHLEKLGFRLSDYAKSVLRSPDFKPTKGVTTEIAILKGMLFEEKDRYTKNIRAMAAERKFITPNAEIACLIRENFSDEDIEAMGLIWIVAMHEPIKDSDGDLSLLDANRSDDGQWLGTFYDNPGSRWDREDGFAFVVSQVSSQN
jgi:hypothetical protein